MSKSTHLRVADCRAIMRLVGECCELGDDRDRWRSYLVEELCRIVDADVGSSGETSGHRGGKPRSIGATNWGFENCSTPAVHGEIFAMIQLDPMLYDRSIRAYHAFRAREDGVALSRREVIPNRDWYASPDYQVAHRPLGVDHVLWCFRSLADGMGDTCGGSVLFRARGRRDFGAHDRVIMREVHAAVVPLIGGPLARFAEPSPRDLAPSARRVLACLLEGDGDKQIAARLELSRFTVNQYTKLIFRHFGVSSRPELLARWIRRRWGSQFPWMP